MNYSRKSFWCLALVATMLMAYGCGGSGNKTEGEVTADSVEVVKIDTAPEEKGPNKTLYGKGGSFGMSTFTLLADNGEKYEVTRVSSKGSEGVIYGSCVPGNRYAMLEDLDDDALEILINLDELELFVKDYYIYNGQLVLTMDGNRDWVEIQSLSKTKFEAKGKSGRVYSFTK